MTFTIQSVAQVRYVAAIRTPAGVVRAETRASTASEAVTRIERAAGPGATLIACVRANGGL